MWIEMKRGLECGRALTEKWEKCGGQREKPGRQGEEREKRSFRASFSHYSRIAERRHSKFGHLVPITLSICLLNIYSHGRRDHVCGMCFLCRTWSSREYDNPRAGHAGVMEKEEM